MNYNEYTNKFPYSNTGYGLPCEKSQVNYENILLLAGKQGFQIPAPSWIEHNTETMNCCEFLDYVVFYGSWGAKVFSKTGQPLYNKIY